MLTTKKPFQTLQIRLRRLYRIYILRRHIPSNPTKGPLQTQRPPPISPLAPYIIPIFLYILSLSVRLHKISHPNTIVFDELHFGRFVKRYRDGEYFFDIHPPLGKLILLCVSFIFGNEPSLDYKDVSKPYGDTIYVPLRIVNAIFGSFVSVFMYGICREVGLSEMASLIPGVMQSVDMLSVIESRMILLEGMLLCFISGCLYCAMRLWGSRRGSWKRWAWLVGTAGVGSMALSVKWTALATPGLIGIVSATGIVFPKDGRLDLVEIVVAGAVAVALYMGLFVVHFWLLPKSGDGDGFMLAAFQRTLVGNKQYYDPDAKKPWFIENFVWLNGEMFRANRRIKTKHPYQSAWYTWIVNHRGLLFHYKSLKDGLSERMYLIVNPAVSIANLVGILSFLIFILGPFVVRYIRQWRKNQKRMAEVGSSKVLEKGVMAPRQKKMQTLKQGLFFFAGYALNLLPYIEVSRCTFLYHFIPALFYSELLLANIVDSLPRTRRNIVASVIIASTLIAFVYWAPWVYATPLTEKGHKARRLWKTHWT